MAIYPAYMMNSGFWAVFAAFFFVFAIFIIAIYVYSSLAMMKIAKRLKVEPAWLAWIPIANTYLASKMAKMHWWPILMVPLAIVFGLLSLIGPIMAVIGFFLMIISLLVLAVFSIIWLWKICEARGRPGWWAILVIIPYVGGIWALVMLGILAWAKD